MKYPVQNSNETWVWIRKDEIYAPREQSSNKDDAINTRAYSLLNYFLEYIFHHWHFFDPWLDR